MSDLNDSQKKISEENLEGMVVVDAGPGTGKTKTVVSRYCNIICRDVLPADVMLLTFTKNAATEMEDRTKEELSKIGKTELAEEMRSGTFDSFCFSVIMESPETVSRFFGIKERLTRSAGTVDNDTLNKTYFSDFMDRFLADRGEDYGTQSVIASQDYKDLYEIISNLMSRGIMPLKDGWFTGGDDVSVYGDPDLLFGTLMDAYETEEGNEESSSQLLTVMQNWCKKSEIAMPVKEGEPLSDREMILEAVNEPRGDLIKLIHDAYYEFIRKSIIDDRLTFGLTAAFAFAVLYSDRKVRERMSCRYLMIDEFQDTNRNQLAIALMLLKEPNLCVVGDWKQGIYGFRHVSTENITDFENRSKNLLKWLNHDEKRIPYSIDGVKFLPLLENYRSSQKIIDFAYRCLYVPGTEKESVDAAELDRNIVKITAKREDMGSDTGIEFAKADDEAEEVVRRIQNYVGSGKYVIHDGEPRSPVYGDIAVLCRKTKTARIIYKTAVEAGIPVFLQGDVDIMGSREGKLLLAWFRYMNDRSDRWGIGTILADQNYPLSDITRMIETRDIPRELPDFRERLKKMKRITSKISAVFDYYKLNNDITQTLTALISSSHRGSLLTVSDIIRMIESDINENNAYSVDSSLDRKAVIIQTIHKSKGLEYPIVIVAGVNQKSFPITQGDRSVYRFSDTMGIRCMKEVITFGNGLTCIAPSWKAKLVSLAADKNYDEERRLLFVAVSRAKQYVTITAGDKPSKFFNVLSEGSDTGCLGPEAMSAVPVPEAEALTERPKVDPFKPRRKNIGVHEILVFDGVPPTDRRAEVCDKGMEYGIKVHNAAEALARGIPPDRDYPEIKAIRKVLDSLKGAEVLPETECSLPFNSLNVSLRGVIDLLAVFPDRIEIHDYKTDVDRRFENEYRIQLSVYAHAAGEFYGKPVKCVIDYVHIDERVEFEPLEKDVIAGRITERFK